MIYDIFKWLHVLFAIAALGSNLTYGILLGQAAKRPEALRFTLDTIRVLDSRLANPSYGLLLLTGLIMIFIGPWSLATPWILLSLIIYVGVALLGLLVYSPTLRGQIASAENSGPDSEEYRAYARRGNLLGLLTIALVVGIVFLMVTKPALWG